MRLISLPPNAAEWRPSRRPSSAAAAVLVATALILAACASDPYAEGGIGAEVERDLDALAEEEQEETSDPSEFPTAPATPSEPLTTDESPSTTQLTAEQRAVAAVGGKGQYLFRMEQIGTPAQVVERASAAGLRHLVIRAGNPVDGFYVRDTLEQLLPLAHAAGIAVVAYDGPAMEDMAGDIARAMEIVNFRSTSGDQIDALGADIERIRAPNLDGPHADEYGRRLRTAVGPDYPLIGIVMNPNYHLSSYPFEEIAKWFDVLSPMDYWTGVTDDGAAFVARSIALLRELQHIRPVSPIGQAYPIESDASYPPAHVVQEAMQAAKDNGAVGISFWSWETTRADTWAVIDAFSW